MAGPGSGHGGDASALTVPEAPALSAKSGVDPEASKRPDAEGDTGFRGINVPAEVKINARPPYPPAARKKGLEGTVQVQVALDAEGKKVGKAKLFHTSGYHSLDDAALQFVDSGNSLQYKPARRWGKPVATNKVIVGIEFRLE